VWLSGNIGNRPLLGLLDEIGADDIAVLEVSSFQTEQLARSGISGYAALITNLTPNHLDWHGSFEEYCTAKENLFSMQGLSESDPCVSIFNAEDEITAEWFEKYHGQKGRRALKFSAADVSEGLKEHFRLAGKMNLSNLAAAACVARSFGLDDGAIAGVLEDFEALPCRLELVRELGGVRWYNDSISTTPVSTIAAIEAFEEPKILIAGGYDKGLPFDELGKVIAGEVKAVVLIGVTAEKIEIAIGECADSQCKIEKGWSMASAVELAQKHAENGDVVLMSPACASYDMFANFRQRADVFIEHVGKLADSS
jgi:UDP-N-acetylmuramoylalanine--D-glutamate ligase